MTNTFDFPHTWVAGPQVRPNAAQDPAQVQKLLEQCSRALTAIQENFEEFPKVFPLGAGRLLQSPQMSDTASSTLTLTTSYQDVPGISVTLPLSGTYLLLYVFDFAVGPAGVGQCLGVAKVGSTVLGNAATFQLGASGDVGVATIANFHLTPGTKGDAVVLQARKTINAGTAQVSHINTRLIVFGPL